MGINPVIEKNNFIFKIRQLIDKMEPNTEYYTSESRKSFYTTKSLERWIDDMNNGKILINPTSLKLKELNELWRQVNDR